MADKVSNRSATCADVFRPINDVICLALEPEQERTGTIIRARPERVRIGTIRGLGRKAAVEGLQIGERIAFFRENLLHKNGQKITERMQELGGRFDNLALIKVSDVLFVIGHGEQVHVEAVER